MEGYTLSPLKESSEPPLPRLLLSFKGQGRTGRTDVLAP